MGLIGVTGEDFWNGVVDEVGVDNAEDVSDNISEEVPKQETSGCTLPQIMPKRYQTLVQENITQLGQYTLPTIIFEAIHCAVNTAPQPKVFLSFSSQPLYSE